MIILGLILSALGLSGMIMSLYGWIKYRIKSPNALVEANILLCGVVCSVITVCGTSLL